MKKRFSKLRLSRETLRTLDGRPLARVAGGQTTEPNCPQTATCNSCNVSCDDSACFSCTPDCVITNPTADSCRC